MGAQPGCAIGTIAALRETSILFAALIGMLFLKEQINAARGVAMTLITAGIVLIAQAR